MLMETKRIMFTLLALFIILAMRGETFAAELRVIVTGIQSDEGEIEVQAFAGEEGWLKIDHPGTKVVRAPAVDAEEGVLTITVPNLTPGEYALAIYHDENMSGALESGFMWKPKEGWAFSNNTKPSFGPPSYTKARLRVLQYGSKANVLLEYP